MYAKDKVTILDRRELLRIKVAALVSETKIILKAERRTFGVLQAEISKHRISVVRKALRNANLALGLIRGRTHEQMEPNRREDNYPDHSAIGSLLRRYGRAGWAYRKGVYAFVVPEIVTLKDQPYEVSAVQVTIWQTKRWSAQVKVTQEQVKEWAPVHTGLLNVPGSSPTTPRDTPEA